MNIIQNIDKLPKLLRNAVVFPSTTAFLCMRIRMKKLEFSQIVMEEGINFLKAPICQFFDRFRGAVL